MIDSTVRRDVNAGESKEKNSCGKVEGNDSYVDIALFVTIDEEEEEEDDLNRINFDVE
jgi:hypothetical protein